MSLPPEEIESLLRLSAVPGVGPNRIRKLYSYFRSFAKVFRASVKTLVTINGIDAKTARNIKEVHEREFVLGQLRRMERSHARLVTFWDDDYPQPLKQIYDPPAFLFVRGNLDPADSYAVAVVGTRSPSAYGKIVAEKLTAGLSQRGVPIVSGLAYGVDTIAHNTSLKAGNRTIAVLGSGVDVIYPAENGRLAGRIAQNGAVLSEFHLGAGPDRSNFPRRNRIICGLSLGVVVVEAGQKSGALITAAMAIEQNREVFAVPGNIDNPLSAGTNALIKQGAVVVTSVEDILDELYPRLKTQLQAEHEAATDAALTAEEKSVYDILSHEPLHVDAICSAVKRSPSAVLSLLLTLELNNMVKQLPGKQFVKL